MAETHGSLEASHITPALTVRRRLSVGRKLTGERDDVGDEEEKKVDGVDKQKHISLAYSLGIGAN